MSISNNQFEKELYSQLKGEGWDILSSGWPDFIAIKDGEVMAVEVKPNSSERLKPNQLKLMNLLHQLGVKCSRWTPDNGFSDYGEGSKSVGAQVVTNRRVGEYLCHGCHQEFPLYEGQRRKYCPECLPKQASEAGKRGGRPSKNNEGE